MTKKPKSNDKALAQNKKARHDYSILSTMEAGMVLTGTEIKSIRDRRVTLRDGYVQIRHGEAILMNVQINEYLQGNQFNHDPFRNRKLLLHKKEILKLQEETKNKGITIVPLKMYLKNGFAKVLIGVAKGKHEYDKRESLKKRDQQREIDRALKNR
ncbi:SsrA-binding protein SmpB [Pediococcus pentosaceus]|uniref:SsrA-binding protein SmpB n=1 Tax=Pediococcus pentosaceus TaxID=1255 RepID=UPI0035934CFA